MSNGDWAFFIFVSLVIGLLVGSYITEKVINWQKNKHSEELREKTELYEYWRARANHFELMMNGARRKEESAEAETKEYRARWADELQKRIELAELVQRREQAQKDTAEFVTEAIKTAKAEVDRGEVSSGD